MPQQHLYRWFWFKHILFTKVNTMGKKGSALYESLLLEKAHRQDERNAQHRRGATHRVQEAPEEWRRAGRTIKR
mgnify:CR=1 FL=1